MCGINGILKRNTSANITEDKISTMNKKLIHRGPDAEGIFINKDIGLGHRRLKIIDLVGGAQPMVSDDKSIVVIFNGEIYNFKEIRRHLESKGYVFKSKSDTETIIYAYVEYGIDCVAHFRGMFGIAIYDLNQKKLTILRDRLGIKPVYYYLDENILVFSSEIKPIITALNRKPEVHLDSLDFYMSVGYVPGENTLFDNIKKLQPGHLLTVQNNQVTIKQYWDLYQTLSAQYSFEEALTRFEELAEESVKLRMISDVPLGAFLSGGLDSSMIVALMSRLSDNTVKTFSVGYRDQPEANELAYARIVADHYNTDHHEFLLEPLDFFNSLETLVEHTEEPIIESAGVALFQLSQLAREHVTVILSGEGGDEILAGYPLYQIMPKVDRLHRWVRHFPAPLTQRIGHYLSADEKRTKYWDWLQLPQPKRYQSISNDVTSSIKRRMYSDPQVLNSQTATSRYFETLYNHHSRGTDLQKMTYTDIKSWLPDDLLVKADKMTMAASLELRVPFLDHKLVEFATSLPDHYRLRGKKGKYLLKELGRNLLPHEIIHRKKKGFPVPINAWLRGPLYDRSAEILLDNSSFNSGYFNKTYIENMLRRHQRGDEDLSRRIFSLLNLEIWHRNYFQ